MLTCIMYIFIIDIHMIELLNVFVMLLIIIIFIIHTSYLITSIVQLRVELAIAWFL